MRLVLADTKVLLMHTVVHAADIQDRDGGIVLMAIPFGLYPFLPKLYANGGFKGPEFQAEMKTILRAVDMVIVKRSAGRMNGI